MLDQVVLRERISTSPVCSAGRERPLQVHHLDRLRVAEQGCCDGPAEVNIEAGIPAAIQIAETGQIRPAAADDLAAVLDALDDCAVSGRLGRRRLFAAGWRRRSLRDHGGAFRSGRLRDAGGRGIAGYRQYFGCCGFCSLGFPAGFSSCGGRLTSGRRRLTPCLRGGRGCPTSAAGGQQQGQDNGIYGYLPNRFAVHFSPPSLLVKLLNQYNSHCDSHLHGLTGRSPSLFYFGL
jgi:hypothetical protein